MSETQSSQRRLIPSSFKNNPAGKEKGNIGNQAAGPRLDIMSPITDSMAMPIHAFFLRTSKFCRG